MNLLSMKCAELHTKQYILGQFDFVHNTLNFYTRYYFVSYAIPLHRATNTNRQSDSKLNIKTVYRMF